MENPKILLLDSSKAKQRRGKELICSVLTVTALCAFLIVSSYLLMFLDHRIEENICHDKCSIQIVESIPEGLTFNSSINNMRTFEAWSNLIEFAEDTIEVAGMYWSLRGSDIWEDQSDWAGEHIFSQLEKGKPFRNYQ